MRELLPKDFYVDFVGRRKFWVTVSAVAVLVSHLLFWTIGPNWSIDFTGGTEIEVKFTEPVTIGEVREALVAVGVGDDAIQQVGDVGDNQFLFRTQGASAARPEELAKLRGALTETFGPDWISDIVEDAQVGSRTTVTYKGDQVELGRVQGALAGFNGVSVLASTEDNTFYVRLPGLAEEISTSLTEGLGDRGVDILRTDSVGPKVGDSLRVGGILSMGITMLMLLLYVAVRFDFEFAPGAILCLFHDASIVCGIWVLTGQEFGLSMISALLTLLGYSINDTIVVYDRIRENLEKYRRADFGKLINDSINQTLSRTIITSGATMLSMVPFLIWGGPVLQQFARAMLIGMVVGCYSTIYVASPLTILLRDNRERILRLVGIGSAAPRGPADAPSP